MENSFPGLWQTWFMQQCVAVGWPPNEYSLLNPTGWKAASNAIQGVKIGDKVIVQLKDYHVGRIGTVVALKIQDKDWNPTVPPDNKYVVGEMGRRIEVRWELMAGPLVPSAMAHLPVSIHPKGSVWRSTIAKLPEAQALQIVKALSEEENWTTLHSRFATEKAISDYIANYPYKLEDGLRPNPNVNLREHVFPNGKRADVMLLDKDDKLVIVECKQGAPTVQDIHQLRGYLEQAKKTLLKSRKTGIRGILVHGGARRLSQMVRAEARKRPIVELSQFYVEVEFSQSS